LSQEKILWEKWELFNNELKNCNFIEHKNEACPAEVLSPLSISYPELSSLVNEYRALLVSASAKSALLELVAHEEFLIFDKFFRGILNKKHEKSDKIIKQKLLTLANAALSRYAFQTYSGTSPIAENEYHYSKHSLLGIGIATRAISNVRRFVENIFAKSNMLKRLALLKKVDPLPTHPLQLRFTEEFWKIDQMFDHPPQQLEFPRGAKKNKVEVLPLITFFSARDGFRHAHISLSAPMESLNSCNTPAWGLHTLTHEISHAIVEAVLALFLPNPNDSQQIKRVLTFFNGDMETNLFDQFQKFLIYSCFCLDSETSKHFDERDLIEDDIIHTIRNKHSQLPESVTQLPDPVGLAASRGCFVYQSSGT
jgi:hypothetical protein